MKKDKSYVLRFGQSIWLFQWYILGKLFCYGIRGLNIQQCISQTQQNFIIFIIVLGQHVSILTESSSGPYLAMFKMCCGIPNAYIRDITMYKMHVSLCYYYTNRILISKTLIITYVGCYTYVFEMCNCRTLVPRLLSDQQKSPNRRKIGSVVLDCSTTPAVQPGPLPLRLPHVWTP